MITLADDAAKLSDLELRDRLLALGRQGGLGLNPVGLRVDDGDRLVRPRHAAQDHARTPGDAPLRTRIPLVPPRTGTEHRVDSDDRLVRSSGRSTREIRGAVLHLPQFTRTGLSADVLIRW